jgi:hypothetical protein
MQTHANPIGAAVAGAVLTAVVMAGPPAGAEPANHAGAQLVGRAVLPVATFAGPPAAGAAVTPTVQNGFTFPLPEQPVQGFSSIIDGRSTGEYLAMPDNGFGTKLNSRDFLIRAYYIRPTFKTAQGGTGGVSVGDYISFRDPHHVIGFPIVNENTTDRLLTGGDIDPESLDRAGNGDLWVGEEFGPWILHFSADGVLLDAPFPIDVQSPNNPFLTDPTAYTQPNSRGFEAMAMTPDRRYLYAILEGAKRNDPDQQRRYVYEFSLEQKAFTGRTWQYHTTATNYMVADAAALDDNRLVLIERDGSRGYLPGPKFRELNVVDLRNVGSDGFLVSRTVVDMTAIPDPNLISLPPIHEGDVGLGDPYLVACESVEAVHPVSESTLLIGCDNNFPNAGRNASLADDNEFILVHVQGLALVPDETR